MDTCFMVWLVGKRWTLPMDKRYSSRRMIDFLDVTIGTA